MAEGHCDPVTAIARFFGRFSAGACTRIAVRLRYKVLLRWRVSFAAAVRHPPNDDPRWIAQAGIETRPALPLFFLILSP
ncbi:hypothetical protein LB565_19145 [Mesorhizobium sp. CA14]|uniref:hypothetical protein n=1 Tax=Mesorhizobium sp. CA14 TaxID=2876642 RepID=UPI001CCB923D|nr:hypothetical protein [Mesorhizobium sp. CA14]MBZ9850103.1 hypothetical protein [Mesorhizobium sp. CA14]